MALQALLFRLALRPLAAMIAMSPPAFITMAALSTPVSTGMVMLPRAVSVTALLSTSSRSIPVMFAKARSDTVERLLLEESAAVKSVKWTPPFTASASSVTPSTRVPGSNVRFPLIAFT